MIRAKISVGFSFSNKQRILWRETMNNLITGVGFFVTIIGFAGLAEAFQGNGSTSVGIALVATGIIIMATQTVIEWVKENKREKRDFNANYPCYLSFKRKGRH